MYRLKLILILIVVGGLIAYIGDKIGMKVGKKRLTLGGLRPKHTSILITICTGILIALMSLSLLLVVSQQFRQVLFAIEDLIQEKEELKREVSKLVDQKQALSQQVGNLTHNLGLFGRGYFQSVTGDIIYKRGEILGGQVFTRTSSTAELEADLNKLVEAVKEQHNLTQVNYNQLELEKVIATISQQPRTIVRLLVAHNTFQPDELTVSFDLYQDYKVYTAGTKLLKLKLSNNNLEEAINNLVAQLNQVGIKAGMLPDKQGQVMGLNIVKFNQLVNNLQQIAGQKRITVLAGTDIWRSDQLEDKIKFRVEVIN